MIAKVADGVWKVQAGSNIYFLDLPEKTVIDTGMRASRALLRTFLSKVVALDQVAKVIFTHLHYDHIGNFDLFTGARFFASEAAIEDLKKDPVSAILNQDMADKFSACELHPADDSADLKIIPTPGHTRGSICIWYESKDILFSGDTMLKSGIGRTDLPTSAPQEMQNSLVRLLALNHKILCPGHDY